MPGTLAVAVLMFVLSSSVCADIYTWKDSQGVVHFTDTPPPDQNHHLVEIAVPVTVPMASNLNQQRQVSKVHKQVQAVLSSDIKHRSAKSRSKLKARTRHKKSCDSYRRKLTHIQSQLRAGYSNSKGNSLRSKRRKYNQLLSWECILR